MGKRVSSKEDSTEKAKITFYRNVNSTLVSSCANIDMERSMRAECKDLMRKHIETLREHMKVRVFLLHAKRKGLSLAEKKNGHEKFKALMDEFDEAKRKIKADFKRAGADKGVLAKHCLEIGQLQRETRWLQTKLEQILCSKNAAVTSQFCRAESAPKSVSGMSETIEEEVDDLQKTEDSITGELPEDVAFFKPSEKSLRSILSVRSNSISTSARDSLGKLRRDSASEALLKLRTMNCVPELRSPRESKSPTKPLKSPRGVERFMAKFPNNSSRETSFSEELSVKGEIMLEELPNTSQLGMLFELSCASTDGTLSKLDSSSDSKRRLSGNALNIAGMDKRADSVDLRKMEKRDSLSNFSVPEVCTAGVKARAEKTSHIQLDANRILLAQYVYAYLSIWPTQETLMETDIEIIKGL
uniref:Lzipper-MIP1 domain-containing protein n=1 Tax=Globodera pallida TaxID=36090 RepID=A0A183CE40_GLOPA